MIAAAYRPQGPVPSQHYQNNNFGRRCSHLDRIPEGEAKSFAMMDNRDSSDSGGTPARQDSIESLQDDEAANATKDTMLKPSYDSAITPLDEASFANDYLSAVSTPRLEGTPQLSRTTSSSDMSAAFDPFSNGSFPPADRLTVFDVLENFALPLRLERMQQAITENADKLRRQRARIAKGARELRKRVPVAPEEKLDKYRRRMRASVDRVSRRWNDAKTVTIKEKISFVTACLNIFVSAYLIGACPEYFHYWYTGQLVYYMPIRWYKYYKIGFHYFLADLCYFVNFLLVTSIWFFPQSKRLLISTYCLAFGNNAVAIAMWRNSLVFHSLDKTTTLFIHIMPCVTLHVLVHLIPESMQIERFPAIHTIKYSVPGTREHYKLLDMILWATLPYAFWQLNYHFLITVRKRSKIAAGRPTSFTWLRKSWRGHPLGKFVLSFPNSWQEPVFMMIQYCYALLTMLPCPIWFWYRWPSSAFLVLVFVWACWNGATYYIDVFGRRFEKELAQLRQEVAALTKSPEIAALDGLSTPIGSPSGPIGMDGAIARTSALDLGPAAAAPAGTDDESMSSHSRTKSEGEMIFAESMKIDEGAGASSTGVASEANGRLNKVQRGREPSDE